MKIFQFIFIFIFCNQALSAIAKCPTGYACVLKDINAQEAVQQNIQKDSVDKFFKPQLKEPKLKIPTDYDSTRPPTYHEIMIFVPRNF